MTAAVIPTAPAANTAAASCQQLYVPSNAAKVSELGGTPDPISCRSFMITPYLGEVLLLLPLPLLLLMLPGLRTIASTAA